MTTPDACAHCGVPRDQHTRDRYAAIPGWHPWTRESRLIPDWRPTGFIPTPAT